MERSPHKSCRRLGFKLARIFWAPFFFEKSQDNNGRFLMVNQVCFPLVTRMSMFVEDISRFAPQILSEIAHLSIILAKRNWFEGILCWDTLRHIFCDVINIYSTYIDIYYIYIYYTFFSPETHIWTRTTATMQWSRQEWSCRGCSAKCGGSMRRWVSGGFLGFFGAQILKWFGDADCFWNPWRTMGYMRYIHQKNTVVT